MACSTSSTITCVSRSHAIWLAFTPDLTRNTTFCLHRVPFFFHSSIFAYCPWHTCYCLLSVSNHLQNIPLLPAYGRTKLTNMARARLMLPTRTMSKTFSARVAVSRALWLSCPLAVASCLARGPLLLYSWFYCYCLTCSNFNSLFNSVSFNSLLLAIL